MSAKQFRIQNKNLLLTYRTHISPDVFQSFMANNHGSKSYKMKMAHEKGSQKEDDLTGIKTDYDHTHILIMFDRIFQSTNCRVFDIKRVNSEGNPDDLHPHIKLVNSREHLLNSVPYCDKEGPAVYDDIGDIRGVNTEEMFDDAANLRPIETLKRHVKKPGDVVGLLALIDTSKKPVTTTSFITKLKDWQSEVMGEIMFNVKNRDNRSVLWVYDPVGGAGKTELIKYLEYKLTAQNKWVSIHTSFNEKDMLHTLKTEFDVHGTPPTVVAINVSRDDTTQDLYKAIEKVKDGVFTSPKYKSSRVTFDPAPAVIVFSNAMPEFKRLTEDRWKFYALSGDLETGLSESFMNLPDLRTFTDTKYKKYDNSIETVLNDMINAKVELRKEKEKNEAKRMKTLKKVSAFIKLVSEKVKDDPSLIQRIKDSMKDD